jgi:competence protein ComEC
MVQGYPFWRHTPFVRILIPFILGIFCQLYFDINSPLLYYLFASLGILLFFPFIIFKSANHYHWRWIYGVSIYIILFGFGGSLTYWNNVKHHAACFVNYITEQPKMVKAILDEPPTVKRTSIKSVLRIIAMDSQATKGRVVVYFPIDSTTIKLKYGHTILFNSSKFQPILNSGNPGCYNYNLYTQYQGIFRQVYLKSNEYLLLPHVAQNAFWNLIFQSKSYLLQKIDACMPNGQEQAIIEALLIGYRDNLDKDLVQVYANTGIVHVLAISGMHLGLLYLALEWLLNLIPFVKRQKKTKALFLITFLWGFSFITGMPGSVFRAVVMYTFIITGQSLNRKTNIYNSMAAAAFCCLAINPFVLADVGFQLSYLAVLGIVFLQKYITAWYYSEATIVNKVWSLVAVSFAAQLGAFPICLYYFHQFPNFFWIANLVAVPLTTIMLFGAIAMLVLFSIWPTAALFVGTILLYITKLLNIIIQWIDALPASVWDGISITPFQTLLYYLIIILFSIWLINKQKKYLPIGLLLSVILLSSWAYQNVQHKRQHMLIVYNVPKHSAIEIVKGNAAILYTDSLVNKTPVIKNFHIKPAHTLFQISKEVDSLPRVYASNNLFQIDNQFLLVINEHNYKSIILSPTKIVVDYVLIDNLKYFNINAIAQTITYKKLIINSNISHYYIDKSLANNKTDVTKIWDVNTLGAFVATWY